MRIKNYLWKAYFAVLIAGAPVFVPTVVFAQTAPWDSGATAMANDLTGPVATAISVAGMALFGYGIMHSEGGEWTKKGFKVGFGAFLAVGAYGVVKWISGF